MAGTTQVTFTELDSMSKKTADTNAAVQGELSRVRSLVESTQASWKGEAHGAFGRLMTQWDSDTVKLNSALREISETLHAASLKFRGQQEEHTAAINHAAAASPGLNLS